MHTDTLRAIDGIGVFPVVSLLLFVIVFGVMLVRTARLDGDHLRRQAHQPMDDGEASGGSSVAKE